MVDHPSHVTDHAVLRYLERIEGQDIAAIRAKIAAITARGALVKAPKIRCNGVTFLLRDGMVTTVTKAPRRKKKPKWERDQAE